MLNVELQTVLGNLFKNAVEAIDDAGTITVTVGGSNGIAYLQIEDSGDAFSDTPNRDLSNAVRGTTKMQGSGIGLPTVKRIVTRAGGTMSIDTREKGTLVRVAIPLADEITPAQSHE
jgi:signal transduction histidine kinase